MHESPSMKWRTRSWVIVVLSFGVAALADFLFYGHPIGLNAAFCMAVMLCLLHVRRRAPRSRVACVLLALAAAGLVGALVEQPTPLNIACAGICIVMLAMTRRRGWTTSLWLWANRCIQLLLIDPFRALLDSRLAARWLARHPHARGNSTRAIGMWVIPVMLSAGFVGLFALANPLIEIWLRSFSQAITELVEQLYLILSPQRAVLWAIAGVLTYALLRGKAARMRRQAPAAIGSRSYRLPAEPPVGLVVRCLSLFNLVFAVQMTLDAAYLYGHQGLPRGITHAQYAHRGSYPLIATALLAAVFVLVTFRRGSATERSPMARGLVYLWIAQNILLMISAAQRLRLYVAADSLTRLRLAAAIWMFLVAAGLGWIIAKIVLRRSGAWLVGVNAATLAVVLYACCFMNFAGFIADFDVRHSREIAGAGGAKIGLDYFRDLGPEALPALDRLTPRLAPDRRREAIQIAGELRQDLARDAGDWHGWTWRRDRLRAWAGAQPLAKESGRMPIAAQIELPTDATNNKADPAAASVAKTKSVTASQPNRRGRLTN